MAGSLVQVATETVSSGVSSVTITGINTDDVYLCTYVNVSSANDNVGLYARITKSGSADSTSNYDKGQMNYRVETSFSNTSNDTDDDKFNLGNMGTGTSETHQGHMYLYNFNNANEPSTLSWERSNLMADPNYLYGNMGIGVHTVESASDGLQFYISSGNVAGGTFTLYKVI
jgi:hypothetical protein